MKNRKKRFLEPKSRYVSAFLFVVRRRVIRSNAAMNTHTNHTATALEANHRDIPSGDIFFSFAIAMIVVSAIYLLVMLFAPVTTLSSTTSASEAALTAALC